MDVISIPQDTLTLILRLTGAAALGAAVGINREMRQKPAGLRTHALVALGGGLFAIIGLAMTPDGAVLEFNAVSRILQGLVAGVGFIGGGVILRRHDIKDVQGLSTAASIWVVSATGVAAGLGLWRSAAITAVMTLAILALDPLDRKIREVANENESDSR